jgi:predicted Zn-dependent protease
MCTGVTRDGCFFVKKGKIDRPVKNFRWQASPFFVLNNIIAMGQSHRTAFGYSPWTQQEQGHGMPDAWVGMLDWPRRPMVVPPLMVRDFNFVALIDAI